jgi:phage gp16-like protein
MTLDRKKLAVIHIVKKDLGLSDQNYRDILERETGVRSAKDLDHQGFLRLMRYFTRSGYYRINQYGLTFRQKAYINHLAEELGWGEQHLNNFLAKYFKKPAVVELSKNEASKVIEALKNIYQRTARP